MGGGAAGVAFVYTNGGSFHHSESLRGRCLHSGEIHIFLSFADRKIVFLLPLFFQAVLSESASKAGLRLIPLAIALPIGGLISGVVMSKWGHLGTLVRVGSVILFCGCYLISTLDDQSSQWKLYTFLLPTAFGQGLVYPSSLFAMLAKFEHSRLSP
jgi:hypothetical protein